MEEKLKYIFEQVNHWLSFTEAKNAMIIAINITLIIAESNLLIGNEVSLWLTTVIIISMLLLILSSVIILYSFLPYTDKLKPTNDPVGGNTEFNLMFFGDISKITNGAVYVTLLYEKYEGQSVNKITCFEAECAHEIIHNSRLTLRKCKLFKYGLYITIFAIATPAIAIIIWLIKYWGDKA